MDLHIYDVIDATTAKAVKSVLASGAAVTLHINSPGGSVTDALAIYSCLRAYKGHVTAVVDGLCASAATVIMLAADEVVMSEHSLLMVHNPWTVAAGDAGEMRKTASTLDKAALEMAALYSERTGQSADAITAIMQAETWYNANEAVEAGFAHRVNTTESEKPRMNSKAIAYFASVVQSPELAAECRKRMTAAISQRAADNTRQQQINAILSPFAGHPAAAKIAQSKDLNNQTPEQVRASLMAALGANTTATGAPNTMAHSHIHAGNGDIIRAGMVDALSARLGMAKSQDNQNPYRTMSLVDMARASLTENGISVLGYGSKMQLVGAAFTHTSSDFSNVLLDISQKAMLTGWENSGETFEEWTKEGSLTNFHPAQRVGLGGFPQLPKVIEGAEYKYISTDDRGAPIALATYGGIFSITRQAIINDDLSAFNTVPAALGRAASRTIGDLVYAVLTNNAKFADGKALFSAEHGNITSGALTPSVLGEARRKMRMQTDSKGNTLNIAPAFMIVPAALESAAMQLLASTSVPGAENNSGIMNPVNNMAKLIVESRLDKASADNWYLTAAKGMDTVEVAYLDGVNTPYIEQQEGFTVDGAAFKVRIDAGVAPLDYRGMARVENT